MLKYNFPHLRSGIFCRMCCYFGKDPFHSAAVCFYLSNVFVSCFAACTEPSIHPPPVVPPVVVPKTYEPWRMEWSTAEPTDGRTKGNSIVNYHRRLQGMACEMGMRNGGRGLISPKVSPLLLKVFSPVRFGLRLCQTGKPVFHSPIPSQPDPTTVCSPKCRRLNNNSSSSSSSSGVCCVYTEKPPSANSAEVIIGVVVVVLGLSAI